MLFFIFEFKNCVYLTAKEFSRPYQALYKEETLLHCLLVLAEKKLQFQNLNKS